MEKLKEISGSKESSIKAQQWLDGFLKIPFGINKKEQIIDFFKNLQKKPQLISFFKKFFIPSSDDIKYCCGKKDINH